MSIFSINIQFLSLFRTSVADCPRLRPFGMIFSDNEMLYIITDKQKSVYSDMKQNAKVELASFNSVTRKWIRIRGNVSESDTCVSHELALSAYPSLRQKYPGEQEVFLAIYQVYIEAVSIN